jgi:hypothetical protein
VSDFSAEAIAQATAARAELARQFLHHADVALIDVGSESVPGSVDRRLVVRVHWRGHTGTPPLVPEQIDGVPVRLLHADYQLE